MTIGGRLTEEDYVAAQIFNLKPKPWQALFVVMVVGFAYLVLAFADPLRSLLVIAAPLAVVTLIALWARANAKRTYRQTKANSEPVTIEIDDEGLLFRSRMGEGRVPWAHIFKWRWSEEMVLIFPNGAMYYLIPRHFFQSNEDFESLLRSLHHRVGKAS
ncbi:MAG: YcxB family protein [Myxococcales bacterium]|nr:YcxB family protein [Myxococcales bacterium]